MDPQDDGYHCKSIHFSKTSTSMGVIGSKNSIKFFKATSSELKERDLTI